MLHSVSISLSTQSIKNGILVPRPRRLREAKRAMGTKMRKVSLGFLVSYTADSGNKLDTTRGALTHKETHDI